MTARLDPSIRAGWIAFNRDLEGEVLTMYLDTRRLVTVAHGVLIDPIGAAFPLPWVSTATGQPATRAEVAAEWNRVKAAWDAIPADATPAKVAAAKGAIWVAQTKGVGSLVRLTHEGMVTTTLARYDDQERDLLRRYPALPSWPVEAQTVCMSIAWAAGTAAAFPKMYAAMHRGDWLTAADECCLRVDNPDGSRNAGLIPRNRRNRALLESLAARLGQTRTPAVDAVPAPAPTEEAPPDTDPMTDAQRREALALMEVTSNQASLDAIEAAYRAR